MTCGRDSPYHPTRAKSRHGIADARDRPSDDGAIRHSLASAHGDGRQRPRRGPSTRSCRRRGGPTRVASLRAGQHAADGAALARILWTTGAEVEVLLFGRVEETRGDARANFEIVRGLAGSARAGRTRARLFRVRGRRRLGGRSRAARRIRPAYRCTLGTGLARPLEGLFKEVVADFSAARETAGGCGSPALVVSLDLPTGPRRGFGRADREPCAQTDRHLHGPETGQRAPPASHITATRHRRHGSPRRSSMRRSRNLPAQAADARSWLRRTRYAQLLQDTHGHALVVAAPRDERRGRPLRRGGTCARARGGDGRVARLRFRPSRRV